MSAANTDGIRMIVACTSGDDAAVSDLLHESPHVAREVPGGLRAPLHYAVREGHTGVVKLLLMHGADARAVVGETLWGISLRTVDFSYSSRPSFRSALFK